MICSLDAIDKVAGAAILPRRSGGAQLIACSAALRNPGLDDRDLALPRLQVAFRVEDLDPVPVLLAAQCLFLLQFPVQAREVGDRVEDPCRAEVVERLGEQVRGAEEGRDQGAQLAIGEAAGQQPVDEQGLQQRVNARVAEPQPGDAGAGGGDQRRGQGGEGPGAADGVVADGLDAEQAPVGRKADLPESLAGWSAAWGCRSRRERR